MKNIRSEHILNKCAVYIVLIILLGLFIYANTFSVPFHFDDIEIIVENDRIKDLDNFWPPEGRRHVGFLSFALNYRIHGLDVMGYHVVNTTIHILNTLLVYFLVTLTFRALTSHQPLTHDLRSSHFVALCSAVIFVAHPVQTQAVTYIVQRFTSLATFFYLLSLVLYVKARLVQQVKMDRTVQGKRFPILALYLLSLVSAILAMNTKEISFTLPFIIVLYEFFFFRSLPGKKRILYLAPFLLCLVIIPLTLIGMDKPIGDVIGELGESTQETEQIKRMSYLSTQFRVITTYMRLLFLPVNQNLDYDYPIFLSFLTSQIFFPFIVLGVILCAGFYLFYISRSALHHIRIVSFGILWFFITLSVESSIIPIRDVIFEHRLYLPGVGMFIAVSSAVFFLINRYGSRYRGVVNISVPVFCLILIALSVAAFARNSVWKDEISLWEDVVKKSPVKGRPHYNLGIAYYDEGRIDRAIEQYKSAIKNRYTPAKAYYNLGIAYHEKGWTEMAKEQYLAAIRIDRSHPGARNNLGNIYRSQGLSAEAVKEYQTALEKDPDSSTVHYNLGLLHQSEGSLYRAIEEYRNALRIDPNYADAYYKLGLAYQSRGSLDSAEEQFLTALELAPKRPDVLNDLGVLYHLQGMVDKAVEQYQSAIKIDPDYSDAYFNLGVVYASRGMQERAIEYYKSAIRLNPDYPEAYVNIGALSLSQGLYDEAIRQYTMAVKYKPDMPEGYFNLGIAYGAKGMDDNAMENYKKSIELRPGWEMPHLELGHIYLKKRDISSARREFEEVLKINPQHRDARKMLYSILKRRDEL